MNTDVASRRHKYAALLVLLLVSVVIQSYGASGFWSNSVRTLLGVAILIVVFERSWERAAGAVILALVIALGWWPDVLPGHDQARLLVLNALMALFLGFAVFVILRDLFAKGSFGSGNVLGAICGYLIAGDGFGSVNAFAYGIAPVSYKLDPDVVALAAADWHSQLALFSYYSFAQMLTINYSDVTPVRAPATTLSLLGTLFGLFYMAVVVSQLVGMTQSTRKERP